MRHTGIGTRQRACRYTAYVCHFEDEDLELGMWLHHQRKAHDGRDNRTMTKEQHSTLQQLVDAGRWWQWRRQQGRRNRREHDRRDQRR